MTTGEATSDIKPGRVPAARLPLALRLAVRDLRSGLGGFHVFIACMALGVAVITAVGALGDALKAGFERQGETILGGDVTLARMHQRADDAERGFIAAHGVSSETATMRSMARTTDGREQTLIELKGVDRAYPLAGEVVMQAVAPAVPTGPAAPTFEKATQRDGGAVVDQMLLERLGVKVGERIKIGNVDIPITGVVAREPDTISDRVTYGPRVFLSLPSLERTGLVQPGSLIRWRYALKLPVSDPPALAAFRAEVGHELPQSGFLLADKRDPSPQITRTLERLRQFLTLIGLTSLLIGGVGVANAVATFIDRRRKTVAVMRSIGAGGRTVFAILFTQVILIALVGIAIGLALGLMVPAVLDRLYGDALPIRVVFTVSAWTIASAIVYGLLVAALFALWPLGRAQQIRAGVLFREDVAPERTWPSRTVIAATVVALTLLVGFAIWGAESRRTAIYFLAAVGAVLAVFTGLGFLIQKLAQKLTARLPRGRRPEVRLAIGNIAAPDGLTRNVVLSLGAGLSLLVAIALTDASLTAELTTRMPKSSPTWFALDLPPAERDTFASIVRKEVPSARLVEAPMLRGRLVRLNEVPVEQIKLAGEAQWVLNGDRGLTYADEVPEGSKVVAGTWWPAGYTGEPLVSFEVDLAKRLHLGLGDTVTVNVLGRNVTARIASLREVKWETLAINFVMVFSPNTLASAPHNLLASVTLPEAAAENGGGGERIALEARIARDVAARLPSVTLIRVKDALDAFQAVLDKVMTAVRVAGSVTLLAGALVLAGALATAQRRRIKQAVILKTVGASRASILASHLVEYLLLALVTAVVAAALGTLTSWIAVTQVMDLAFDFSIRAVWQALGLALALVLLLGMIGSWSVLRAPPVPYLRSE